MHSSCEGRAGHRGKSRLLLTTHAVSDNGLLSLSDPLTPTPGIEDGQEVGSSCLEILQVGVFSDENQPV